MSNYLTIKIDKGFESSVIDKLNGLGWTLDSSFKNQFAVARLKSAKGFCTIYSSGKVLFQGSSDFNQEQSLILGQDVMLDSENAMGAGSGISKIAYPHIGSDEVGKGDYFGPLVVAAAYLTEDNVEKLRKIGVGDSKKITDVKIVHLYEQILEMELSDQLSVGVVHPKEYNNGILKTKNVAILLAREHAKQIDQLLEVVENKGLKCEGIVIDQFSASKARILNELTARTKKYKVEQFHKGESDMAVAAASVVARAVFLQHWIQMEAEYGMNFPKGASNVINTGKVFIKKFGVARLAEVAKISFKTTKSVIS